MVHIQYQPGATLPAQEIVHPGEGFIEGHADIWGAWNETEGGGKQMNGFVPGICLQPPVMHQAQETFLFVMFGESVCQIAQYLPLLPFIGERADHPLGILPVYCLC